MGQDAGAAGASYDRIFGHLTEAADKCVAEVSRGSGSSVHQFRTRRDA